ncbi:hypothetical protein BH09ACT8_BH09ACT8_57300 [soil metagenome]
MSDDSFPAADRGDGRWVHKLGCEDARGQSNDFRFRLTVLAPNVVDVVSCIGGWLFDRAMLGWDVTVFVADTSDARPLHILGAKTAELEPHLTGKSKVHLPDAVSIAAELYDSDTRLQRNVLRRLDRRRTEVTVWGPDCARELRGVPAAVSHRVIFEHRLSLAAQTFKAHALGAFPNPSSNVISPTEQFCDARLRLVHRPRWPRAVDDSAAAPATPDHTAFAQCELRSARISL